MSATFHRSRLLCLMLVGLALSPSLTASAQDPLLTRAATGVGKLIAAQGNAALLEIREELRQDLLERLRPAVPAPDPAASDLPAQPSR
jgi:hypothetical protein